MLYSHNQNRIYELKWTNETHFFIKINLSFYSRKRGLQFVVSLRNRWRDIYSERGLLLVPYLLPGARGKQRLHPLASRIVRDDLTLCSAVCHWLDSRFSALCLNLTAWLSRGLLRVTHLLDLTALTRCHPLFTNHNMTACQSTWSHKERTKNPCHVLYNIGRKIIKLAVEESKYLFEILFL